MGRNVVERLKDGGVEAKKGTQVFAQITDVFVPTDGPLDHPRFRDAVVPAMWLDIAVRGVEKPIVVRDDGLDANDKRKLLLVDGGRRTANALWAWQALITYRRANTVGELAEAAGVALPAGMDPSWPLMKLDVGRLFVPIEFFHGTDTEVLLERLRRNADPLKKPDSPSVLARTIAQLGKTGCTDYRVIAAVVAPGIGPAELEALSRWDNLVPEARERFDAGAPLGLLAAVLDASRDRQVAKLDELIAAGITTTKGATRHENKKRAERAASRGEAPAKKRSPKTLDAVVRSIAYPATEVEEATAKLETFGAEAVALHSVLYGDAFTAGIRFARGERVARMPKPIAASVNRVLAGKKEKKS